LLLGAARRARPSELADGTFVLRYHWAVQAFGWITALLIDGFLVVAFTSDHPPPTSAGWVIGILCTNAALAALIVEPLVVRVHVSNSGISIRSPWGRARSLAWEHVTSIVYSPSLRWFVVTGVDGTKIRVNEMLIGIPQFLNAASTHASESVRAS